MRKRHCIRYKITVLLLFSVLTTLSVNSLLAIHNLGVMKKIFNQQSEDLGRLAAQNAEKALEDTTGEQLLVLAVGKADFIEEKFHTVVAGVHGIARLTEDIYCNPDDYPDRQIALPIPDSKKLAAQLLWSEKLAGSSLGESARPDLLPKQNKEIAKLGNIQDLLVQYNAGNDMISSTYLATKSGWMIQADYIAYSKYSGANVTPDFYEAEERPWFQEACLAEEGEIVYSDIIPDIHEGRECIVCAQPVYVNGQIVAVAGIGSYLDIIHEEVLNTAIGNSGYAFLVNQKGQIVVSGAQEGESAVEDTKGDLRNSSNKELAGIVKNMTCGARGLGRLVLDGREVFLAYAPLEQLGWSLAIVMNVEEVIAPARESERAILALSENVAIQVERFTRKMLEDFVLTAVIIFLLVATIGIGFAGRLSRPIRELTARVSKLDGGNLDSEIHIRTGDEVEELGNAFNKMTAQMKEYIRNLAVVTAEKERVTVELTMASKIQADMLPDSGHALRRQEEFSIYASMTPAREVGGDFYDFYLMDEDHLVILIADVSGKGIPAALFMVVAKTLLQSNIDGDKTLAEAVSDVNKKLCEQNKNDMFVTLWVGVLELSTGIFTYVNAGHNPPLWGSREDGYDFLKGSGGFVLAGMEGILYRQREMQLIPGEILFLYTDGVTEANDKEGNLYGEVRLQQLLNRVAEAEPEQIGKAVWEDIQIFQGDAEQFDDVTMLVLRYLGKEGASVDFEQNHKRRNVGSAHLSRINEVANFAEEIFLAYQVPLKYIRRLGIVVDELFANICHYSHAEVVVVEGIVRDGKAILIIEDDGVEFNPLNNPDPDVKAPIAGRRIGGLGIYLVRELMDEVLYDRKENKNRLTLIMQIAEQ